MADTAELLPDADFRQLIGQPLLLQSPLQVSLGPPASKNVWVMQRRTFTAYWCRHNAPMAALAPSLQAVLELLFGALKAQSTTIDGLKGQVNSLDTRERELRHSLATTDERQQGAAEALQRVLAEHQAAAKEMDAADARLQRIELQLQGANNLAGRQLALDDIASMLGVDVPQVQCVMFCAGLVLPMLLDLPNPAELE